MDILLWFTGVIVFISALLDILKKMKPPQWKILWIIICLAIPYFGSIAYFIFANRNTSPRSDAKNI